MTRFQHDGTRFAACEHCGRIVRVPRETQRAWCEWCTYSTGERVEVAFAPAWWLAQRTVTGTLTADYTPGLHVELVDDNGVAVRLSAEQIVSVGSPHRFPPATDLEVWR